MENGFRIRSTRTQIILCFILAVLCSFVAVIMHKTAMIIWIGVLLVCVLPLLFFSVDCTKDEVCVNYGFIKRRISTKRISAIQFVSLNKGPYLIICIDGHRPFDDNVESKFFFISRKVICIAMPYLKSVEYAKVISELYENVTIEKSFIKWQDVVCRKIEKRSLP